MRRSSPSFSLFAYGTLIFPEVWRRVTGDTEARRSERATLDGFALRRVRDAQFPGIVAEAGAPAIPGVIYFELDEDLLARLDAYEDSFYERIVVHAVGEKHARPVACQAYVVPPYLRARVLTDDTWSAEEFEARHLEAFSRQLRADFAGNG